MHILFIHSNFPAQFGPCLKKLTQMPDVKCVFVNRRVSGVQEGVFCLPFHLQGGATSTTHYCSRTFENAVWQSHAVYEACRTIPEFQPDLIVGHSGFGSTALLPELYEAPIINYFEYYYHPHNSDMDFRPDFPPHELDFARSRMRNAMILIDLQTCTAGYSHTLWQKHLFPSEYQQKIHSIHDGIDTDFWSPKTIQRRIGNESIPDEVRIVTYVSGTGGDARF